MFNRIKERIVKVKRNMNDPELNMGFGAPRAYSIKIKPPPPRKQQKLLGYIVQRSYDDTPSDALNYLYDVHGYDEGFERNRTVMGWLHGTRVRNKQFSHDDIPVWVVTHGNDA